MDVSGQGEQQFLGDHFDGFSAACLCRFFQIQFPGGGDHEDKIILSRRCLCHKGLEDLIRAFSDLFGDGFAVDPAVADIIFVEAERHVSVFQQTDRVCFFSHYLYSFPAFALSRRTFRKRSR